MRKRLITLAAVGWFLGWVLASSGALADPARDPGDHAVGERILNAVAGSRDLERKAKRLPRKIMEHWAPQPHVREDRRAMDNSARRRFPLVSHADKYDEVRVWGMAYSNGTHEWARGGESGAAPASVPASWPGEADAPALRELLGDRDAAVRGLAIEALATLHLPEDAGRIGALLEDVAEAAPVLGYSSQMAAHGVGDGELEGPDPVLPLREWHTRTVQAYAREALELMTGRRFDGLDSRAEPFAEWWKRNNLGRESLWYWEQRLNREFDAIYRSEPSPGPGENDREFRARASREQEKRRASVRKVASAELRELTADTEAKAYLLTTGGRYYDVTGPVNSLLEDPPRLRISRERALELLELQNLWPDVDGTGAEKTLLRLRLGRLADRLFLEEDKPRIRAVLERDMAENESAVILVSRLLPAGNGAAADDPDTRDGYLRRSFGGFRGTFGRSRIAREMIRVNVEGHWDVLKASLFAEPPASGDPSLGTSILHELGFAPYTKGKFAALCDMLEDPRAGGLLMQPKDRYRQSVRNAINAHAGREIVGHDLIQQLGTPERSNEALETLRAAAAKLGRPANDRD